MRTLAIIMSFVSLPLFGQQQFTLPVWPDGAPQSNGLSGPEKEDYPNRISNVSEPTLNIFLPEKSTGAAVIICPGGGYALLAVDHEGYELAPFFNEQGIALAVLKYRMPNGHQDVPLADAEQAMRIVRSHATEWHLDPSKIGIMGSSAGGHLASTLATHFSPETRPDFQILLYPVITMDSTFSHGGTRYNLLGKDPSPESVTYFSNELQVTPQTPPAFIALSDDDTAVPPQNSLAYYQALRQNNVGCELHIYPEGGHGWGFRDDYTYKDQWTHALHVWLDRVLK